MADIEVVLCPLSMQSFFDNGQPLVGARVYLYEAGTTTPITAYKDVYKQAAHPRPILTNAQGRVPPIYVDASLYRVRILDNRNVPIEDIDGILGMTESSGGGPGPTPTGTDLITGDVIWSYMNGPRAGFTRCNGGTIGMATSGASNIAVGVPSDQTQPDGSAFNLFKHLWENDSNLPVYSASTEVPRGSTSLADWDANRTLGVPDLRGRTLFGLDNMGNIGAGVAQVTALLTTTQGVADATVSDATGLYVGMYVVVAGVPEGARITAISGLTITLSALPSIALTQATTRFSTFTDAQKLGSMGGEASHILIESELAEHNHEATTTIAANGEHDHTGSTSQNGGHTHPYGDSTVGVGTGIVPGGGALGTGLERRTTDPGGLHSHSIQTTTNGKHIHTAETETEETGGNLPHNNFPPAVLGSFYMKL